MNDQTNPTDMTATRPSLSNRPATIIPMSRIILNDQTPILLMFMVLVWSMILQEQAAKEQADADDDGQQSTEQEFDDELFHGFVYRMISPRLMVGLNLVVLSLNRTSVFVPVE